jgi:hypothetical protein
MYKISSLNIYAQLATIDDDYEWYAVEDSNCSRCSSTLLFHDELSRYPLDQQSLLLLVRRPHGKATLPWMVTLGPIETPWCDRFFGRPIRIRLVIECEHVEIAFGIFSWGLQQWWEQREIRPLPDPHLATLPRLQQPAAIADWIKNVPLTEMLSSDIVHEPWPNSLRESPAAEQVAMIRQYSGEANSELLEWLTGYLQSTASITTSMNVNPMKTFQSQFIAAVSQGMIPRYHRQTLRALGAESFFPAQWQHHSLEDELFAQRDRRRRANAKCALQPTPNLMTNILHSCQRYVIASLEVMQKVIARRLTPENQPEMRSEYKPRKSKRRSS